MAPTQRHRWLGRAVNRNRVRRSDMERLVVETARTDFERRHPSGDFGPVVVLIAAYEEERNLGDVLDRVPTEVSGLRVSTLVVIDGGNDGTDRIAMASGVFTCVLPVNLGQGAALHLGYDLAVHRGARYIVTLDADGQNDPSEMEALLDPILADQADLVIASRRLGVDRTTDRFRRAGVRLFAMMLNVIIGEHLTDTSNGYRAFRADLVSDIGPYLVQRQYQTAEVVITAAKRGWRIAQRPAVWHPRASGRSKKGGNILFGLQYARVIGITWVRMSLNSAPRS
jgi:glycosyltransferase involved in cell wall biosynthesis